MTRTGYATTKKDLKIDIERINAPLPEGLRKSIRNVQWANHTYKIRAWLSNPKYVPAIVRKYGQKNWRFEGKGDKARFWLFDREIIDNNERRNKIFDKTMGDYGGIERLTKFLQRKYLGISYQDTKNRHALEERRQLKAERRKPGVGGRKTFIAVAAPGVVQCDTTKYGPSGRWPVFGLVDIFSRFGIYILMKNMTPKESLWAFKIAARAFQRHTKHRIYRVETDGGTEYKGEFAAHLKTHHIHHKWTAQPQRLIESMTSRSVCM